MLTRTQRTVAFANSGALGSAGTGTETGTEVCRAALKGVIPSTAAKIQIVLFCRFALPFPRFIAPLPFVSTALARRKSKPGART